MVLLTGKCVKISSVYFLVGQYIVNMPKPHPRAHAGHIAVIIGLGAGRYISNIAVGPAVIIGEIFDLHPKGILSKRTACSAVLAGIV